MGCGESKEALEPSVTPKATPEKETRNPELPKADVKKPLTEEESAKIIEASIRKELKKPTGELTKADFEKVTELELIGRNLTEVKGLEKLTQLTFLDLTNNKLTDVIGLKNLTQITYPHLGENPDLTKAQIAELQKALPNCTIISNPKK